LDLLPIRFFSSKKEEIFCHLFEEHSLYLTSFPCSDKGKQCCQPKIKDINYAEVIKSNLEAVCGIER